MIPEAIPNIFVRNKTLLQTLSNLLDEEKESLVELDSERIIAITGEKKSLLEKLDTLNLERRSLLLKASIIQKNKPEEGQFRVWLNQYADAQLTQLVDQCESLLAACKTKNSANEQLLHLVQQRNTQLLEILKGNDKKARVYTATGDSRPVNSRHTIGRA